ncbi:MAG: CPBP family intramembrane glutamic endopeptidase [Dehalogenimonas sp.]
MFEQNEPLEPLKIDTSPVDRTSAPSPAMVRFWGFWPTLGFSAIVGVVNGIAGLLAVLAVVDFNLISNPNFNWTDYVFNSISTQFNAVIVTSVIVSDAVSLAVIGGLVLARHGASIKEYLALNPIPVKTVVKIVFLTLGLVAVSIFVDSFRNLPNNPQPGPIYEGVWPVFAWFAVVLVAPLFEEVMFRGFMFQGFLRTRLGPALAIILPAIWWGLLHAQYGVFDRGVIIVLGIVLATVRLKTGSLYAPLVMHATWNFVSMIQLSFLT